MCLLFIDVDHFIALGAFLDVPETISLMKVDFIRREGVFAVFAVS